MNQVDKKENKNIRDEVSPSIRDFISNFRKQQAQQAKQNAYQQSIKKTIPIQQITQLKQNRQSVDTQTDLEEQQQLEQSQKRSSVQLSHRQQSTYSQSLTTREVQVQCDEQKQRWICQDDYPSARVNFHYLNNHFQSVQSQQSEHTSSNTYQQIPFVYRSPQKIEQSEVNLEEMTEKILNKVIKELDKRNGDNISIIQNSNKKSLSISKQNNLSITNQTVSLSVLPQPKNEDDDSFIKFIQMSLVKKNKILYEDQENLPPSHQPIQQYSSNLPKQREQHSKSTLNKTPFTESNKTLYSRANTNTKSNAHQRLYQDACMRQERKTLGVVRKMKF